MKYKIIYALFLLLTILCQKAQSTIVEDHSHYSSVLGETRYYRAFLPSNYQSSGKRYPVIYWFHGSGGSYSQDTYKVDFENYVNTHDVIIINVDGTTDSNATWDYGLAYEYATRTQEGSPALTGMNFAKYLRELIQVVDSNFRTIANRDHRATSGQSMGGLMSPWVASQNKDLIACASIFSPSPDCAMFGPLYKEVCFVNRELYRSLKGLPLRITAASGDRFRQYNYEQKAVWELMDLTYFQYYEANYPDHKAVEIPKQFDFHMQEFAKQHAVPQKWHHADPFPEFTVWNYQVRATRNVEAFTILEKVTPNGMLISSRTFMPDGPFMADEDIIITTDSIYQAAQSYTITDYNRSSATFSFSTAKADNAGKLQFSVIEGGHALGINKTNVGAKLFLIPANNREDHYIEVGKDASLSFTIVNVGGGSSGPIQIKATTPKSFLRINQDTITIDSLRAGQKIDLQNQIPFKIASDAHTNLDDGNFVTKISLTVSCNGTVQDVQYMIIYVVPATPTINTSDILILDGGSKRVPVYDNKNHRVNNLTLSGGSGNGNFIWEAGETVEIYVKLPQGLGSNDKNTYHPAFLMNLDENAYLSVGELRYNRKGNESSGAANLQSKIKLSSNVPVGQTLNLWLKCESYEFKNEGYSKPVQRHRYDYRRVNINLSGKSLPI